MTDTIPEVFKPKIVNPDDDPELYQLITEDPEYYMTDDVDEEDLDAN